MTFQLGCIRHKVNLKGAPKMRPADNSRETLPLWEIDLDEMRCPEQPEHEGLACRESWRIIQH